MVSDSVLDLQVVSVHSGSQFIKEKLDPFIGDSFGLVARTNVLLASDDELEKAR